ncbi:hypothetical protein D3C78_1703050 [compost metagenome]
MITLIRFTFTCNCSIFARVSVAKLSIPITVKLLSRKPKFGKELSIVRSKSLKSTLALTFSLIDDLTLATILSLNSNGTHTAAPSKTTMSIAIVIKTFFSILVIWVLFDLIIVYCLNE